VLIYLPVYALAPFVLPLAFGKKWTLIVSIARALTPFMIVALVASPCSRVLVAVRQTGVKMVCDVMRLIVAPTTILIASRAQLPFTRAISWFGIVMSAAYVVYFGAQYVAALRVARRSAPTIIVLPPSEDVTYVQE
jgi:O-antigen/teichoic acid export membrane protein